MDTIACNPDVTLRAESFQEGADGKATPIRRA